MRRDQFLSLALTYCSYSALGRIRSIEYYICWNRGDMISLGDLACAIDVYLGKDHSVIMLCCDSFNQRIHSNARLAPRSPEIDKDFLLRSLDYSVKI